LQDVQATCKLIQFAMLKNPLRLKKGSFEEIEGIMKNKIEN